MSAAKVVSFPAAAVSRRGVEREFLPAALEIIDTPPSPAGRATALVIALATVSAITWASIGKVDIIASAPGKIIPIGMSKTVQPLEAGVVRAIRVDDGDHVNAGEPLIELDRTGAEADRTRLTHDLTQAQLDQSRLLGLREAWQKAAAPALVNPPTGISSAEVDAAAAAMRAQYAEQAQKLASIDQQIVEKHAEAAEAQATLTKLKASLPLVAAEADVRRQVMEMQFGNKIAWLEAQQRLVEQQHELAVVDTKRDEATASQAALERQRDQTRAEYEKGVLADLAKAEQQANQAGQELVKANQKAQLQTLRAPITGTVQQLSMHTVGGVVTPAQPLLVVVPDTRGLVVEAHVENKDVGFVHAGQSAEIKVESFNFARYGLINGTVLSVSHDAVSSQRRDSEPRVRDNSQSASDTLSPAPDSPGYTARIHLARTTMTTESGEIDLSPGMSITAEIKTGRRRISDFIISPLITIRQEGLIER